MGARERWHQQEEFHLKKYVGNFFVPEVLRFPTYLEAPGGLPAQQEGLPLQQYQAPDVLYIPEGSESHHNKLSGIGSCFVPMG